TPSRLLSAGCRTSIRPRPCGAPGASRRRPSTADSCRWSESELTRPARCATMRRLRALWPPATDRPRGRGATGARCHHEATVRWTRRGAVAEEVRTVIPSIFGLIVILVGLVLLFRATPVGALMFMMSCTLLGGSAAITLTAIGGSSISPAHLALVFLIARIVAPGSSDISRIAGGVRANVFLSFYGLYVAVTAIILPRPSQDQCGAAPMPTLSNRGVCSAGPLGVGPRSLTTAGCLPGSCSGAVAASLGARR